MTSMTRGCLATILILVASRVALTLDADSSPHAHPRPHARHARQLHRILDPFGLLGKAGKAVNEAVEGVHGAVENLGRTLDEGVQNVGKMMEDGAASFDSLIQNHMEEVQSGLEEAGKVATIVGEDLVDSVSSLVSNHLQEPSEEQVMTREGMVDGFLRMLGINPSQVGLMVLNVLIFLAELITSSLVGEKGTNDLPETRTGATSMLEWVLGGNPLKVEALLQEAQDPGLPRTIIEKLVRATGDDTACLQLLVCKVSPLVWGLQRTVKNSAQARAMDPDVPQKGILQTMYDSLPELDDFVVFSESCERQFPACPLLDLSQLGL
ncbi:uncharacterized protein [Panulirus ornatus]|uniref:uncharacterized protein n=1 Tax=Panulirus ornatus TaxID=150431 RepID=UPI003A8ACD33